MTMLLLSLVLGGAGPVAAQTKLRFPAHPVDQALLADGVLAGRLWTPAGAGPHPAIVMMHGCGGLDGRDGEPTSRHRDWAERFAALGYVVLHVDSFGPRGVSELCTVRHRSLSPGRERARDAYAALAFLQARPDVRPEAVALLGWSNGGSTTLYAVSADTPARPAALRLDFAAAVAFYPGCRSLAERRQGWMTAIRLLILIGEADDWTPAAPCRTLLGRAQALGAAVELVTYAGAYHDFDSPDRKFAVRSNIATTSSGRATVGTDPAAREDALARVPAFVARSVAPR